MKYSNGLVVVEAEQYIESEKHEPDGLCWKLGCGCDCPHLHIGDTCMAVRHGDWIITSQDSEKRALSHYIFTNTYKLVETEPGKKEDMMQMNIGEAMEMVKTAMSSHQGRAVVWASIEQLAHDRKERESDWKSDALTAQRMTESAIIVAKILGALVEPENV